MIEGLITIGFGILLIALVAFVTLLPLIVWTFCQQAPRPSWPLAIGFVLWIFLPRLGALFTIIYILNIIITHRARVKAAKQSENATVESESALNR